MTSLKKPERRIFRDRELLSRGAAETIIGLLTESLQNSSQATLVLSGGETPRPIYEILGSPPWRERLDWKRIHFYWGDERCVPPDSSLSNFRMAWDTLLRNLSLPQEHIHRIPGEMPEHAEAARIYEEKIKKDLPTEGTKCFDLALLGIGEDGHAASLFPDAEWNEKRLVDSMYVPKLDSYRITMTPRLLNMADVIVFVVSGRNKAKVMAKILQDAGADLPAKRILPHSGRLIWMMDHDAALELTPENVQPEPRPAPLN